MDKLSLSMSIKHGQAMPIYSVCCNNGVNFHHSSSAETQRQEEKNSFIVEQREGFRHDITGGYGHGKFVDGLTKSGHPMWSVRHCTVGSFQLVLGWEQGQK